MEPHEVQRWELPGYSAYALQEPFPWTWAAFWSLWGLTVAALVVWNDGAYAVGAGFVAWGALMGCFGWRALSVGAAVVHDWAKSHCTDPNVELAAIRELIKARDLAAVGDSPANRRWIRDELFTATFSIPWLMGLNHGVAFGGLAGAALALVPGVGFSATAGAIVGSIGGAAVLASLFAVMIALLPLPRDALPTHWSMRQRALLAVSPLLAVPALLEAVVIWWRWHLRERLRKQSLGDT